jgi:hypothetical protein
MTRRVSIRRRIGWKITAWRHRTLDTPNMSEMPWSTYSMDEQTGEIFDRRTFSKRAAMRRFKTNGFDFSEITVQARHARYMTTQEIWAARDRDEEWRARLEDAEWERGGEAAVDVARATIAKAKAPVNAPDDWEPDGEWDPAWQLCSANDPNASPVWLCELADA